ncbi:MAG: YggT family protein [Dichotomicrobium sp.]
MIPLLQFISWLLGLYVTVVVIAVIFSWLIAFNVINTHNQFVRLVSEALYKLTEPALRPIRNALPDFGGLDLSPVVLIIGIYFIQSVVINGWLIPLFAGL